MSALSSKRSLVLLQLVRFLSSNCPICPCKKALLLSILKIVSVNEPIYSMASYSLKNSPLQLFHIVHTKPLIYPLWSLRISSKELASVKGNGTGQFFLAASWSLGEHYLEPSSLASVTWFLDNLNGISTQSLWHLAANRSNIYTFIFSKGKSHDSLFYQTSTQCRPHCAHLHATPM